MNEKTSSTGVGPMRLNIDSAKEIGWTQEMIEEASERMGDLSREFTMRIAILCEHCGRASKRTPQPLSVEAFERQERLSEEREREILGLSLKLGSAIISEEELCRERDKLRSALHDVQIIQESDSIVKALEELTRLAESQSRINRLGCVTGARRLLNTIEDLRNT